MQGLHRLNLLDKVRLLQTPVAGLIPVAEDLLEVLHLQLLEVDCAEVDLLLVSQLADLFVFLLQLLTDFVAGHGPRHGLRHLPQDAGGGVRGAAEEVAQPILFGFERLAEFHELLLDLLRIALLLLGEGLPEPVQHRDADLALSRLEGGC